MYERMDIAVKGSLLHDIGKIIFRNDHSTGNHSKAGSDFISDESINIQNKKEVLDCIKYHHYHNIKDSSISKDNMAYIVYEADNIASGLDRRVIYDAVNERSFDEKMPLHSVFNQVNTHKNNLSGAYPIKPRFMEKKVYIPKSNINNLRDNITQSSYGEVISLLKRNLSNDTNLLDSPNSILKLLETVATAIPSSTNSKEIPDISIYDHSKITCALASCMYMYSEDNKIEDYRSKYFESRDFRDENAFLLLSGDLSGIQDFIYTISSKGALRSLRGRSIFLEIMLESIIDDILDRFNLTRANLIYSGGGHFYILLPNLSWIREDIKVMKNKINDQLLDMFFISLYLEMDYKECSADDLGNGLDVKAEKENLLGEVFSGVSRKVSVNKLQRYKNHRLSELFSPDSKVNRKTQHERECVICGESDNLVPFQGNSDVLSCNNCDKLATLGTKIASISGSKNQYLITIREDSNKGVRVPSIDNTKYLDVETVEKAKKELINNQEAYNRLYSINEPMMGLKYSTNLWIGNYNKRQDLNMAMEFEQIAQESSGMKRLAVLRADVDDLGRAFTHGFEKHEGKLGKYDAITFSRTATFSRDMTMFFKYEINKLCNGSGDEQFNFRLPSNSKDLFGKEKNIVIVYSGGDDVFAVGPWDEIIEFSVNLRDAFKEYSLGRLSLSAGVGLFPKGYPISQMAIQAGQLESIAKKNKNETKDSIALFSAGGEDENRVFTWDEFKEIVCLDKMSKLNQWLYFDEKDRDKNKLYAGSSLLYRLYELFSDDEVINVARLAYQLGRLKPDDKYKEKTETYKEMKTTVYSWALDKESRRMAAMAINLIIMLNRS